MVQSNIYDYMRCFMYYRDNVLSVNNLFAPIIGTIGLQDLPSLILCSVILKNLLPEYCIV